MQECSAHSRICLLFPWVRCQSFKPVLSQCSQTGFVTVDNFIALYSCSYVFYSHGCNKFLDSRMFLHSLIPLLFPSLWCIYMQEYSVQWRVCLLFPWVLCQCLKPVLSQRSQTSFVTVDHFIALYTRSYIFYSHGRKKFLHAWTFLHLLIV